MPPGLPDVPRASYSEDFPISPRHAQRKGRPLPGGSFLENDMSRVYTVRLAVQGFVYMDVDAESPQQAIDKAVECFDKRTPSIGTDDIESLPGESSAQEYPS